ncbi:hypothetical protein MCETRH34_00499 [Candidatus Methylopumilus universalis]
MLCAVIFLLSRVTFNSSQLYSSLSIHISSKKSPLYEGKYSLGDITLTIDCETMMNFLCQLIITKSRLRRLFKTSVKSFDGDIQ